MNEWMELKSEYDGNLKEIESMLGTTDEAGMPISCGIEKVQTMIEKIRLFTLKLGDFIAKITGTCEHDKDCE